MVNMQNGKRVFALGFFDGVHRGHQALLHSCRELAAAQNCKAAVLTFDSHPDGLVTGNAPVLINSVMDRRLLLRKFGIGPIYTIPFNREVMSIPWQEFFRMLVEDYGAAGIVCGDDFRFGYRGEGNAENLKELCGAKGIPCVVVSEQQLRGQRISSTYIRDLIESGRMEDAVEFLGHPHILTGTVVPGRQLGHKLGFPTANVLIPQNVIIPKHGVYACRVEIAGKSYQAVTNVGSRPTVDGHQVRTESWILDFDGDLYGEEITLAFYGFLRPEQRFDHLQALMEAVARDAGCTREYFKNKEKIRF